MIIDLPLDPIIQICKKQGFVRGSNQRPHQLIEH